MDLDGKLLIAMPGMGDPRFEKSVILICAHSDDGAMGLIVNRPARDLSFANLLEQLNIPSGDSGRDIHVHYGGPVERGRGFVLHSRDYRGGPATMQIDATFGMTATLDILKAIAQGAGPESAVLALGLPIINALTTDGHLIASLGRGDWALASVDLFMIVAGLVCAACAWRLNATPAAAAVRGRSTRVQEA